VVFIVVECEGGAVITRKRRKDRMVVIFVKPEHLQDKLQILTRAKKRFIRRTSKQPISSGQYSQIY